MKTTFLFSLFFVTFTVLAQTTYRSPLDIPLSLSANFGELRPNHFHSGIDIKTDGKVNKPVYAVADGYVSRISVSPRGFGLALYINHKNGQTSVYGHLNSFATDIAAYVRVMQYANESYAVDLTVKANLLPVKQGDLVAYSGNTGSSGGPHVHFEIRTTASQVALDALSYYRNSISDTEAPLVKGIAIYPIADKGVVNKGNVPIRKSILLTKKGAYIPIKDTMQAWGTVGIGIQAIDKMNGSTNIFGVKRVRLLCDGRELFVSDITSVSFDKTRMINSLIDYDYWVRKKTFYMKSFVEPGNKLPIYSSSQNGSVDINQERMYTFTYQLEDLHGNKTSYEFVVKGVKQALLPKAASMQTMAWNENNNYSNALFSLSIPKESLYTDIGFNWKQQQSTDYVSSIYRVNTSYVPLNTAAEIKIKIDKDTLSNKSQYGIVTVRDGRSSWVGGVYKNGFMVASIRDLGNSYAVSTDDIAPEVTVLNSEKWVENKEIRIKATDKKSGVKSYRGTIDGKFALFEHDIKSTTYLYKFDTKRLTEGKTHNLVFRVVDEAGNVTEYNAEFVY